MFKVKVLELSRRLGVIGMVLVALNVFTTVVFAQSGEPGTACPMCGCVFWDHYLLCWPMSPFPSDICYTHILYYCNYGMPTLS